MSHDPISFVTILDGQSSGLPTEVKEQISDLWTDMELGNDGHYWDFNVDFEEGRDYPIIASYLRSRGVDKCKIHYWW